MGYLVTARKWRPLKFSEVVGQRHVTQTLANAIRSDRIHHAYLFSGPRGVGKTTTARILARAVNCTNREDAEPCNQCMSCRAILEGKSLDVIEIDGASNNSVDDIRKLREDAKYSPSTGKYKMYIIDEVHMLSTSAFNALLKILEEPPSHLLFVFATTEPHKVPATILSRCQRHEFNRIESDEIISHLSYITERENIKIDSDSLAVIARKADGSMRDAQSILDQVIAFAGTEIDYSNLIDALHLIDTDFFFRISNAGTNKDKREMLNVASEVINKGYDLRDVLSGLIEHYRNLLSVKATGNTDLIETSENFKKKYLSESERFSEEDLMRIMNLIAATEQQIRFSPQPRIRFELTLLQIASMDSAVEIKELIEALKGKKALNITPKKTENSPKILNETKNQYKARPKPAVKQKVPKDNTPATPEPPRHSKKETSANTETYALSDDSKSDISSKWQDFVNKYATSKTGLHLLKGSLIDKVDFVGKDILIYPNNSFTYENLTLKKRDLNKHIKDYFGEEYSAKLIEPSQQHTGTKKEEINKENGNNTSNLQTDNNTEELSEVEKTIVESLNGKRTK